MNGETVKKVIGWLMILLGAVVLTGAVADSKVGGWVRAPNPPPVTALLDGVNSVAIRADRVHVKVTAEDRPDLAVTAQGSHSGWVQTRLVRQGTELQVRVTAPWWHRPRNTAPTTVEIRLPQSFHGALALEVGEGSLALSGASAGLPATLQELTLKAQTAMVEIRNIQTGRLTYDGQTGALIAESVRAKEADLHLVTGKIELGRFAGALRAEIATGFLEARLDALTGPITVEQVSGRLVLDLPPGADFSLDAAVTTGVIRNELTLKESAATEKTTLRGTQGAGTHAIGLRVGTGDITVR